MSQSDYIRYKRLHRELTEYEATPQKLPVVFDCGKYISYKEFSLENTILSVGSSYDKYIEPNVPVVFGMVKKCAAPTMELCRETNLRGNRPTPDNSANYPAFRTPALASQPKSVRMKWHNIMSTTMCTCIE
jgi:hypothetical protein